MNHGEKEESQSQESSSSSPCPRTLEENSSSETERDRAESGPQPVGYVYFIETADSRFVKIGFSENPVRRIGQLGTLRPEGFALRMIGWMPGSLATERWFQSKFEFQRDKGEWFRSSDGLRQFVAALGLVPGETEEGKAKKEMKPRVFKAGCAWNIAITICGRTFFGQGDGTWRGAMAWLAEFYVQGLKNCSKDEESRARG